MNIQTDPARIRDAAPLLPAAVDTPIRFTPGKDLTLHALGYDLAAGRFEPEFDLFELDLRQRANDNADTILAVVTYLGTAQQNGEPVTPAANWLLDNHYLVEDTILQVRRDLPARFFKKLPLTTLPDGRQIPRALVLAWTYVAQCDSAISVAGFETMVAAFQEVDPLSIGELWALPSLLRFVLVENLRRLAVRVKRAHEMRLVANKVADEALAQGSVEEELRVLGTYEEHARDTTFATQLLFRLRDGTQYAASALGWLETELERFDLDAEEVARREHATLSSGNVTTGNIIKGLRLVDDTDWTVWFEQLSHVDQTLRAHTDFADLDFHSRDQYRRAIEELAAGTELSERDVTERAIAMAADRAIAIGQQTCPDIGLFVVGPRRPEFEHAIGYQPKWSTRMRRFYRRTGWTGIVVPAAALTALLLAAVGFTLEGIGLSTFAVTLLLALFLLPASEAALGLFNTIASLLVEPTRLIGYEYKEGVPADARTLVALPILIGSRDDVEDALHNLEVHFLANMQGELDFAILSDWRDSQSEQTGEDMELLDYARKRVAALNDRYPRGERPRFHVLHRRRLFNEAEGVWMGWERKRGKLHELNALLRGDLDTTYIAPTTPLPANIQYVLTLDADTRMTRDAVAKLVGKMSHPLNRPVIDARTGRIVAGYGILQPRVTPSLTTGNEASFFQRIFSANRGMDPYVFAVSDVYQDLFDSGTFTGKGLYHIDAMEAALKDRIPENAVLSHDLLEGAWARCALVTDVELIEDYPTRYSVDASRNHRWIRGDWQLLPFILDPRSEIPGLSRWKMVDNLRRSLMPISWVLASIAGWTLLPFAYAAQWQALLILSLVLALTYSIVDALMPRNSEATLRSHFSALAREFAFATAQVVLKVVLIAHQAWASADAIVRTLSRVFFTRRKLLEWRTASDAARGGETLPNYHSMMVGSLVIALIGFAIAVIGERTGVIVAGIFLFFWAGAPAFAWLIIRSAETEDQLVVDPEDAAKLRTAARRTWLYYETFVTAEHNFLPPDNFQEIPSPVVAPRTSPTNIGIYLLSVVSARDFGWISLADAIRQMEQTLSTIERMERHRGHLYNWYDTQTLNPLLPLYVSSVDSGNLAGHLVAVAATCNIWAQAPAAHLQGDYTGILDCVTILEESLDELPDDRRPLRPLRQRLRERVDGMRRAVETIRSEPETAAIRTINLAVLAADIRKLARSIDEEIASHASETLALWANKLEATCQSHIADSHMEDAHVSALRRDLVRLRDRARQFAFEMEFSFLMRADRKLLSIGYRVDQRQLDEACYDLLASEARLTSLFGIAKGDLPTDHWMRLGRPVTLVGFAGALVSWSGSMFEYLMPPLVMKEPLGGILNQTSNLIITRQIRYARSKGIPWGISESAYNARDREMTYQYTNFGVPGLGLKRGLAQNTVIAPYATLLASQFKPREAVLNLAELTAIGGRGRYGFYDAIDFTPSRVPTGATCAVVRNYMAHHTGMSIVAVANVVFEGRMRDRFHSDAVIEAAELLLQEKAPRDVPATKARAEAGDRSTAEEVETSSDIRVVADPVRALPATSLMSNGYYSVMLTAKGTGYSRCGDIAVTRWSGDPVEDRSGTFIFVSDPATGAWWSATGEPKAAENERCEAIFSDDKATFMKRVGPITTKVEAIVTSEANGEARRITISNTGETDQHLEVTSYGELALAPEASDQAHPAFSKMFVKTTIANDGSLILARRNKRSASEADVAFAHFVTAGAGISREARAQTDRREFLGRGRSIVDPAAFDRHAAFEPKDGFTLDPILSIRCKVRVPAGKEVSLTFWTVVTATEDDARNVATRFDNPESFERQAMLAWTRSQVQTRHVGLSLADAAGVQKLARYLLYPDPALRAPSEAIIEGLGSQSALWPASISGDFPIFALRIADVADLEIVASALRMQEYLRTHGLVADLVIVNEQASSYVQDLQQAIEQLCDNSRMRGRELGPRQHIFAVRRDLMDERTYKTLLSVARVVLHTRNGTIFDQIDRAEAIAHQDLGQRRGSAAQALAVRPVTRLASVAAADGTGLALWNGYGGFADDGRTYVVRLDGRRHTPQPWINVIANENFGFHVSAEGAAFTWSRNSRDFQITPWTNDPVTNRPGEGLYVVDRDTGEAFSPVAAVLRDPTLVYEARHGQGVSTFSVERGRIAAELTHLVDPADPVRISRLKLANRGDTPRRLRVYAYVEWVMGVNRTRTSATTVPGHDAAADMVTATNPYHLDYGDRVAFLAGDRPVQSFTCDRAEFLGLRGSAEQPAAVMSNASLSRTAEAGRDICGAIAFDIDLDAAGEETLSLYLGDAGSLAEARSLVQHHRQQSFDARLRRNAESWRDFADALQVETPDPAFDALVNTWLPYQAFACRIRARAAFYQASGAYGFRDQLQDTLALLLHDPSLARTQILNAAGRQFREGDVQHWWLPRSGAGVRTMISDDVVWLAHGTHRYVTVTGDATILDETLPFLEGEPLQEGQHDSFFTPQPSKETAPLYEHCARALDIAVRRTGPHGLPLILGGDWNDGMNRVGEEGRGESVWLGWFLAATLRDFAVIAEQRGDGRRAEAWRRHLDQLKIAIEDAGWDGEWYRRGYFDDGSPLGSSQSDECRIDSLAQSWAVLSGFGPKERASQAMTSAGDWLLDEEHDLIRLFTPPFENTPKEPGYIKGYPPGVRENGGQYTHAATWFVLALAALGRTDDAYRAFSVINPVNHALDRAAADAYRVEPYVVAADVYSEVDRAGRGGWTWYTGSAGWLYRAAVEGILGIERAGETIAIAPRLPSNWPGFNAKMRFGNAEYRISIVRGTVSSIVLDGTQVQQIKLADQGHHEVVVTVANGELG